MESGKIKALLTGVLVGASGIVSASSSYNLSPGVTDMTREVYDLHMLIFWICCAIGVVVFGAMIYSIIMHRKSVHPKPADFHESIKVEIAWTIAPFAILIYMAVAATGPLIRMEDTSKSDLTVKITGYQWKWHYDYIDHDVDFFSTLDARSNEARQLGSNIDPNTVENYLLDVDNPLVLPVGKKVRLLLTANDVLHAWWVPEIVGKKDAIPGFINKMWVKIDEEGTYRGQCAELCGRDHGFMPIVVKAVSEEEFAAWVASQGGHLPGEEKPAAEMVASAAPAAATSAAAPAADMSTEELLSRGEKVYGTHCAACHQPDGSGMEAANFPAITGGPVSTGPADVHIQRVLKGQNAMASFTYLSDADIAAVVSYERNALGNATGDWVQPADVAAQRGQ